MAWGSAVGPVWPETRLAEASISDTFSRRQRPLGAGRLTEESPSRRLEFRLLSLQFGWCPFPSPLVSVSVCYELCGASRFSATISRRTLPLWQAKTNQ